MALSPVDFSLAGKQLPEWCQKLWYGKNCWKGLQKFIFMLILFMYFALHRPTMRASCQIVSSSSFIMGMMSPCLACLFKIESSSKLLVTRTGIKAWMGLILGIIRLLTLELHVLGPANSKYFDDKKKKMLIVSQALHHLFQMPLICLFFRLE